MERSRLRQQRAAGRSPGQPSGHPIGTPTTGASPHTGPLAASAWLAARDLIPDSHQWSVQYVFDVDRNAPFAFDDRASSTRFQLEIYAQEWGYVFRHQGKVSWIRVTDIPFVHGRDEHGLLPRTPKLREIGPFVRQLEQLHGVLLPRDSALIRSSIRDAEVPLRLWALEL